MSTGRVIGVGVFSPKAVESVLAGKSEGDGGDVATECRTDVQHDVERCIVA